ncbi:unnamed protein product [Lampetra planeri]
MLHLSSSGAEDMRSERSLARKSPYAERGSSSGSKQTKHTLTPPAEDIWSFVSPMTKSSGERAPVSSYLGRDKKCGHRGVCGSACYALLTASNRGGRHGLTKGFSVSPWELHRSCHEESIQRRSLELN